MILTRPRSLRRPYPLRGLVRLFPCACLRPHAGDLAVALRRDAINAAKPVNPIAVTIIVVIGLQRPRGFAQPRFLKVWTQQLGVNSNRQGIVPVALCDGADGQAALPPGQLATLAGQVPAAPGQAHPEQMGKGQGVMMRIPA